MDYSPNKTRKQGVGPTRDGKRTAASFDRAAQPAHLGVDYQRDAHLAERLEAEEAPTR